MGAPGSRPHPVTGLCLDAGALIAVERRDRRVLRLLELALESGGTVDVPSGAVAQSWRGGRGQVLVARILKADGVRCAELDLETAGAVGELCAATGGTEVVDGHVALHALRFGLTVVTSDPDDIALFAPEVRLVAV